MSGGWEVRLEKSCCNIENNGGSLYLSSTCPRATREMLMKMRRKEKMHRTRLLFR